MANKTQTILAGSGKLTPSEQKVLVRRCAVALGRMDRIRKRELLKLPEYAQRYEEDRDLSRAIKVALYERGTRVR